ncbi:flagellar basal body rod protein FlgC [Lacisediminimonas profundi]|uniref:flagellar basal body rod protein FlgC n=1 Tax=Lacisediminimonas profundi TaxID=2603856 RepID=UPI00124B4552|nr:flagellar basal body rod protein FlgC [Lacisediminimonas profundi]
MDYQAAFAVGAAGMAVEKARADIAASNIAHTHVTRAAGTGTYRAARVLIETPASFPAMLAGMQEALPAPRVVGQVQLDAAPRLMHEPGHPHADANGFVAYPRIDTLSEMLGIMQATRAYEANVSAIKAGRSMAMKALEIGGGR